jgi:hypothetical protein
MVHLAPRRSGIPWVGRWAWGAQNFYARSLFAALHESASLIGRLGSSAFRLSTTTVATSLAGSCFSTESAHGPFRVDRNVQSSKIVHAARLEAMSALGHALTTSSLPVRRAKTPAAWRYWPQSAAPRRVNNFAADRLVKIAKPSAASRCQRLCPDP